MPIIAPCPADAHMLLTLLTGRGSLIISARRTSRSARISSTNRSLSRRPPQSRRLNAEVKGSVPRSRLGFTGGLNGLGDGFDESLWRSIWQRPFPHRTRLVRRRNRGQKLDNDRTESARLQRDAVSPQDWFSNARRAAAEGARDSGALANTRAIRTVARRGGRAAALYPS